MNYSISFKGSYTGHKNTVEYLVSKGSDVNIKDNDGRTPLYMVE